MTFLRFNYLCCQPFAETYIFTKNMPITCPCRWTLCLQQKYNTQHLFVSRKFKFVENRNFVAVDKIKLESWSTPTTIIKHIFFIFCSNIYHLRFSYQLWDETQNVKVFNSRSAREYRWVLHFVGLFRSRKLKLIGK